MRNPEIKDLLVMLQQVAERMVRVETRVTNSMRAQGLLPTVEGPEGLPGAAFYNGGKVYVTSPHVTMGEVSRAAVMGIGIEGGTVEIIVANHVWGTITIEGKRPGGKDVR